MPTPDEIGQYASQMIDLKGLPVIFQWAGYITVAALILGILYLFYMTLQYRYKVTMPVLQFSPDGQAAYITRFRNDRARTIKKKGGLVYQQFLWSRKKCEKFKTEDIKPKNRINILTILDDGVPGVNINSYIPMPSVYFNGGIAEFGELNPEEKYLAIVQLKEINQQYADTDAQKRIWTYMLIAIAGILIFCGITVWLCLKAPNQIAQKTVELGKVAQNIANQIGGGAPPV